MPSKDDSDMAETELGIKRHRALYRAAHRGTREMDFLLGHYGKAKIPYMNLEELQAFEELMTIADPVLAGALVDGAGDFDEQTQQFIDRIRKFHNIIE